MDFIEFVTAMSLEFIAKFSGAFRKIFKPIWASNDAAFYGVNISKKVVTSGSVTTISEKTS